MLEGFQIAKKAYYEKQTYSGATNILSVDSGKALIEYTSDILFYAINSSNTIKTYMYVISTDTESLLGTMTSALGTPTYANVVVREFAGVVYTCGSFKDVAIANGNATYQFMWDTYTISTTTYAADDSTTITSVDIDTGDRDCYIMDFVSHNSTYYWIANYRDYDGINQTYQHIDNIAKGALDSSNKSNWLYWYFGGYYVGALYRWVAYRNDIGANDWMQPITLTAGSWGTGTAVDVSDDETTTEAVPKYCHYIEKASGLKQLILNFKLYEYKLASSSWVEIGHSGTDVNCVQYLKSGETYVPGFVIFDSEVYDYSDAGGRIGSIQTLTDTDYICASESHLITDAGVYKLNRSAQLNAKKAMMNYGYEISPSARIAGVASLSEDSYLLYDREENLVGKVMEEYENDLTDAGPKDAKFTTGIAKDLRRRVSIAAVSSVAPHTYLTTYVFPLCDFIYEGTLDSTQAARDWPAYNNTIGYILRDIDLQYSFIHAFKPDYSMDWSDGRNLLEMDYKRKYVGKTKKGIVDWGTAANPDLTGFTLNCDTSEIIATKYGSKNLLHIIEASGTEKRNIYNFANPTSGILEFKAREIDDRGLIGFYSDGDALLILIRCTTTTFVCYYGDGVGGVSSETHTFGSDLPHFNIEFDMATDTFTLAIDGIIQFANKPFWNDNTDTEIGYMVIGGYDTSNATELYFDALALSWNGYVARTLLWTNSSGASCTVSRADIGGRPRVLDLYDNSAANTCNITHTFSATQTSCSLYIYFRTSNAALESWILIGNTAETNFGAFIRIGSVSGKLDYLDLSSSAQTLADIVADTWYLLRIDPDSSTDTFSAWLNGAALGTGFEFRNTIANMTQISIRSAAGDSAYHNYFDLIYTSWESQLRGSNELAGLIRGITGKLSPFKKSTNTYKIDTVYMKGKFVSGVQSTGEAHASTPGNYDMIVDLPEEVVTDAMATVILTNHAQNQEVYSGYVGKNGYYQYGKLVPFRREKTGSIDYYYLMDSSYNGATRQCFVTVSKYLIIPKHENTTPMNNRQLISATETRLEQRIYSRDVLTVYLEQNERQLDENLWGFFHDLTTGDTLNSGTPINLTVGCHRIYIVVKAGTDIAGTITITGNTRDRTDTSNLTVGNTEDIIVDALSTDSTTTDAEGNTIHEHESGYLTDNWFEGAITITTTNLTLTDVDVHAILYHQYDSCPSIKLDTLDATFYVTNTSAWFYAYFYAITRDSPTEKKYCIARYASLDLTQAISEANNGYRRRKVMNQTIDGSQGDGVWLELFFGPNNQTYFRDITVFLSALLDTTE